MAKVWATESVGFEIGAPVIRWDDKNGLNLRKTGKFTKTNINDLNKLRESIHQFTLHWSVTYRASHCYNGLIAQGLSANFIIDDDCDDNGFATIYQCLPINELGWSQGSHTNGVSFNRLGPGVEICYQPQKWEDEMYDSNDRAKWKVPEHKHTKADIHGTKMNVYLPTDAQMKSVKHLVWGFCELFPDVPVKFPRDNKGKVITTVLNDPLNYKGLIGHFHLKRGKIDPAGIDFDDIENWVTNKLAEEFR